MRFRGIGVSPGIATAEAHIVGAGFEEPTARRIREDEVDGEMRRLEEALKITRAQILEMQKQIAAAVGSKDASIFDAHLLVLEDHVVLDEVVRDLKSKKRSVEWVFFSVLRRYIDSLRKIDDPYLRERVIDVEDVMRRVIRNLRGELKSEAQARAEQNPHVLLAHDLTPSDTATIDRECVLGFATEVGGTTSHTAIMARSLNIPAVVGLHGICGILKTGDELLLDGYNGLLVVNPGPETISSYERLKAEKGVIEEELLELKDTKSATKDGREITLSGNIEFVHEAAQVAKSGAEGVGLYRTEFFYMRGDKLPTEDEQAESYTKVALQMKPHGVIFRTLDIGGDKVCKEAAEEGEEEPNPFLGWRGIRVSLQERALFKDQLRAILRASGVGKVGLMYPLVSSVEEVRKANGILEECKQELLEEGVAIDENLEVGAMIEVPSAAMTAEVIASEVDFFSVGTNDLVQYTIAVDRVNERVAELYQPAHPAVIRLMKRVVDAAREHGIWAGICGEMAGDIVFTPLLLGLGFGELSVAMGQLPRVKRAVQSLESATCERLAEEVLDLGEALKIYERCVEVALQHYPELLK